MIEINLVPDVKQQLNKAERVRSRVVSGSILIGLGALGVIAILLVYVFAVQTVRSAIADEGIKKGGEQLAAVEDLSKILTIQNQLSLISELNDQKKIDSRIFDVLSAVIPPAPNNVQVSSLLIDAEGSQITIEGQTRAFDVLEVFKKTVDGAVITYTQDDQEQEVKLATDISASDISYGEDATGAKVLRFTLRFIYAEELFSPTVSGIVIKLVNEGNVTDSYLGLPKSIFAPRATDSDETEGTE
jgi:Tfp pilus assembly protein PilN